MCLASAKWRSHRLFHHSLQDTLPLHQEVHLVPPEVLSETHHPKQAVLFRISHQLDLHLSWNLQSPLLLCWSQWALMAMTLDRHWWELEMTSMWQQTSYWKHSLVELTYCNFVGKPLTTDWLHSKMNRQNDHTDYSFYHDLELFDISFKVDSLGNQQTSAAVSLIVSILRCLHRTDRMYYSKFSL